MSCGGDVTVQERPSSCEEGLAPAGMAGYGLQALAGGGCCAGVGYPAVGVPGAPGFPGFPGGFAGGDAATAAAAAAAAYGQAQLVHGDQCMFGGYGGHFGYGCGGYGCGGLYPGMHPMYGSGYAMFPGANFFPQAPLPSLPPLLAATAQKPGSAAAGTGVGGGCCSGPAPHSPMMPGDWVCPQCSDHVFARNKACRRCGAPRPEGAGRDPAGSGSQQPLPGDWHCPKCRDLQFARNQQCRMCGCAKPDNAGLMQVGHDGDERHDFAARRRSRSRRSRSRSRWRRRRSRS